MVGWAAGGGVEVGMGWKPEAPDYIPFDAVPGDRVIIDGEYHYSRRWDPAPTHGWAMRDGRVGRWYCGEHEPKR